MSKDFEVNHKKASYWKVVFVANTEFKLVMPENILILRIFVT